LLFMTLQTILGQKIEQSQKFLEDGTRVPITRLWVKGNVVVAVKTNDKDHYSAIQLGFGSRKKTTKTLAGHIKGAKKDTAPKFLKEVRTDEVLEPGTMINASEILKEGDIIDITGTSKGKGYTGVVKRHHFKGGPRTHGQSDRERAPGSIGQTTTPGRVYKGKRMAGRMGQDTVTIKNLTVVGVTEDEVLVKGLVPGSVNSMVIVKKVGENKKFTPLFREKEEEVAEAPVEDSLAQEVELKEEAVENKESSSLSSSNDVQEVISDGQAQISSDAQAVDSKTEDQTLPSLSGSQSAESGGKTEEDLRLTSDSLETDSPVTKKDNKVEDKKEKIENVGK